MASNIALSGLAKDLKRRQDSGTPIRIGLIGTGEMGTDIIARTAMMDGIEVAAVRNIRPEAAHRAIATAKRSEGLSLDTNSVDKLGAAVERGLVAVASDPAHILESGLIDIIVDATGIPSVGAEIGLAAMERGKHLVMMNVEADVTIGAYLRSQAERCGVVYTLGAGDEPSSCMELIEFASSMGHKIVCAGKGKNNPLNIDATPDDLAAEAAKRNMNKRMLAEFVDGSKTMVEMAAIANATGLVPDKPGMHGPAAGPKDLAKVLVPETDGGVLKDIGRVDYSVGAGLAPGVFVIVEAEHPRVRERMKDLKMGDGPYYAFVRPYHLTSLEVPLTCARAVLYGKADMAPLERPTAEVCAVAKKDLVPGETLDQIGEHCYRAWVMEARAARQARAIPCGLLAGGKTIAPVAKGDLLTLDNASTPPDAKIVALRAKQDEMAAASCRKDRADA